MDGQANLTAAANVRTKRKHAVQVGTAASDGGHSQHTGTSLLFSPLIQAAEARDWSRGT
jgi:hypothetical protein